MRLLGGSADGSFNQTLFVGHEVASYATLSHTREADGQGVTFEDMMNGGGKDKVGYRMIQ